MFAMLKTLFGLSGEQIGPQQAVQRMNRGAVLVDVRSAGEFAAGHARGALHVPLERIQSAGAAALQGHVPDDAEDVLLICASGMRSRLAQARLAQARLAGDDRRRYANVAGGTSAWQASGLPMARG